MWKEVSSHITAVLLRTTSRICSKEHETFLCSYHVFFLVQLYYSTDMATDWKNFRFILSEISDVQLDVNLLIAVNLFILNLHNQMGHFIFFSPFQRVSITSIFTEV